MNSGSLLRVPWSARVYTIVVAVTFALVLAVRAAAPAPMGVTIEPAMTRGPANAPVTIVEFSDYQ